MMVKQKLYWALAAVIALCIGSFVLFKPKTQLDPIKIYKVTTPAPKPSFPTETNTDETEVATQHGHNPGYSHAHPHETGPHAPAAETAPSGGEDGTLDVADAFLPDDFVSEEEPAEYVPVSPFGFGPYPEVPADYFGEPSWARDPDLFSEFPNETQKNIELIHRVLIKLWQQGDREIVGGSTYNGKVYPHYDNVVYVRWKEYELPDGSVHRYVSRVKGAGEGPTPEDFSTGNIPSNLKVIDLDDAGFDPYQFLNLSPMEEY